MTTILPPSKLNRVAVTLLVRELGPVNTIRFLQQHSAGDGNYTQDRDELFQGMSVDDIVAEIKRRKGQ